MELREYLDDAGRSPFGEWFESLPAPAARRVVQALAKLEAGLTGNLKAVGSGVSELKIDFGPGYRVYFGREASRWIVLLGGGSKKRQSEDIHDAIQRWNRHKKMKGN
jgi:putative addiction module killer protein